MLETVFTLWGAPVTRLEILAFVLSLVAIALNVLEVHWAWPFTIVSSALYGWLFYASKLFGEAGLQVFFMASAVYGWYLWRFAGQRSVALRISRSSAREIAFAAGMVLALGLLLGALMKAFTANDAPFLDAFPTAGSLIATLLLAQKRIENWHFWLVVNAVSIALFIYKALYLTAVLYAVLMAMAIWGLLQWRRAL